MSEDTYIQTRGDYLHMTCQHCRDVIVLGNFPWPSITQRGKHFVDCHNCGRSNEVYMVLRSKAASGPGKGFWKKYGGEH